MILLIIELILQRYEKKLIICKYPIYLHEYIGVGLHEASRQSRFLRNSFFLCKSSTLLWGCLAPYIKLSYFIALGTCPRQRKPKIRISREKLLSMGGMPLFGGCNEDAAWMMRYCCGVYAAGTPPQPRKNPARRTKEGR